MNVFNDVLQTLRVDANIFHNGQYCGDWTVDTTGTKRMNFHVVSAGHCYLRIGAKTIRLEQGDAVIMPTDSSHTLASDEYLEVSDQSSIDNTRLNKAASTSMTLPMELDSTGLVCGNFSHRNPVFYLLVENMPDSIIIRSNDEGAARDVLKLMIKEAHLEDQSTSPLLNRLADCLFYILVRDHLSKEIGVFAAIVHPKLSAAIKLIHEQLDAKLTLDTLSEAAGMSRASFISLFRDLVGQTPNDYMVRWRMAKAYQWLAETNTTTLDAALRTGYESEASFSKAFKRVIGVGPGKVRAQQF